MNVAGGFSVNVGVSLHGLRFSLKEFVLKFIREKTAKLAQPMFVQRSAPVFNGHFAAQ